MSFAEWLCRYLTGQDMAGPNRSAFYPGPVQPRRRRCPPPNSRRRGAARIVACSPVSHKVWALQAGATS